MSLLSEERSIPSTFTAGDTAGHHIQPIVGSIVLLANPLTTHALAALINIPKAIIDDRLDLLRLADFAEEVDDLGFERRALEELVVDLGCQDTDTS